MKKTIRICIVAFACFLLLVSCSDSMMDMSDTVQANPITITYMANGGVGSMGVQDANANKAITLKDSAFKLSGKIFTGWNTSADGSGKLYAAGEWTYFATDTILYAQWATVLTADTTTLTDAAYALSEDVKLSERITVSGNVRLILLEGTKLVADKGIEVSSGNTLVIDGSSKKYGELEAYASSGQYSAIGCGSDEVLGTIIINGGKVYANGQTFESYDGIGIGAARGGSGGSVTINGGNVSATGGYEEGAIGNSSCDTVIVINNGSISLGGGGGFLGVATINGGRIKFDNTANNGAPGELTINNGEISVGENGYMSGNITINGGYITGSGGIGSITAKKLVVNSGTLVFTNSSGIYGDDITVNGGSIYCEGDTSLAFGCKQSGGSITINGGTITAITNSSFGSAFGFGYNTVSGSITINGGTIKAIAEKNAYCGICGGGKKGNPSTVTITINGGFINASASCYTGCGIGRGLLPYEGTIRISGGIISASGGNGGYAIGSPSGNTTVIVENVEMLVSSDNSNWSSFDGSKCERYMKTNF